MMPFYLTLRSVASHAFAAFRHGSLLFWAEGSSYPTPSAGLDEWPPDGEPFYLNSLTGGRPRNGPVSGGIPGNTLRLSLIGTTPAIVSGHPFTKAVPIAKETALVSVALLSLAPVVAGLTEVKTLLNLFLRPTIETGHRHTIGLYQAGQTEATLGWSG